MKFDAIGFGELAPKSEIAFGDLFVIERNAAALLVFVIEKSGSFNRALILAELGGPSDGVTSIPRVENFDLVVQSDSLVRRLSTGLTIEPASLEPPHPFLDNTDKPAPNGVLAIYPHGGMGIYVRPDVGRGATFDLKNGDEVRHPLPRQLVHWRLLWTQGANTVELYNSLNARQAA